jgi:homoserine dehydrogenase
MIIRAAMVGLGNVNRNLLRLIAERSDIIKQNYGVTFKIVLLADSSGYAVNSKGFDIPQTLQDKTNGKSILDFTGAVSGGCLTDAIKTLEIDVVFEGSPVDLQTGGTGLAVTRAALENSVSVVLANKAPVVLDFDGLHDLARKNDCSFKYSATFCGGLPVLNVAARDMVAGQITKVRGIFNATSNFILDEMAGGASYQSALQEAQDRGIAEADPSLDVGGWDTANKLLILANSIWGGGYRVSDVNVSGITGISANDLQQAAQKGRVIKLVASANEGELSVAPIELPRGDFLAECTGWEMAVEMHTDIYGINSFKLWEREPVPTAASMLRDAIHIFSDRVQSG